MWSMVLRFKSHSSWKRVWSEKLTWNNFSYPSSVEADTLKQGWATSVLEGHCPAEFRSNPNQIHLDKLINGCFSICILQRSCVLVCIRNCPLYPYSLFHTLVHSYSSQEWTKTSVWIRTFSTAWYDTVRFSTVHFWVVFHWVLYLVPDTFLVPLRPSFQAIRTVTKTWQCKLYWSLIGRRKSSSLRHWTCDTRPNIFLDPARFKSAQPAKDRTQLFVVCWGSTNVPLVDSRGADSSERLMGRLGMKKSYVYTFCTLYIFRVCFLFIFLPLYLCFASIKNNLIE